MHMPDGYINLATSAGAAVIAAGGVGASLRNSTRELAERQVPLAGLTAAYVFAVQMLNFPVAAGTSGHLLGGALAAILLGPTLGALVVTIVVVVQALLFADGGISALGLNVLNMALITAVVGWLVFRGLMRVLPAKTSSAVVASMVAAAVSVVASSIAFVLEYSIGGQGGVAVGTVLQAMVGVHVLIGLGEGLITALTVGTVLAVRPDLVKGVADRELVARPHRPEPGHDNDLCARRPGRRVAARIRRLPLLPRRHPMDWRRSRLTLGSPKPEPTILSADRWPTTESAGSRARDWGLFSRGLLA